MYKGTIIELAKRVLENTDWEEVIELSDTSRGADGGLIRQ